MEYPNMKISNSIKKIILAIIIFTISPLFAGNAWEMVLEKDGIMVFTREVEGSSMDQFKGETIVNAPIESCIAVFRDIPAQVKWMGDCLQAKILKSFNSDHLVVYNVLHAAWPLSNRDLQIDVKISENIKPGQTLIDMKVYPELLVPLNKKYVRVTDFEAKCFLERISADKTRIIYINRINPMAPVPSSIANRVVRKNPYTTLTGLRKMVKLNKYRIKK